MSNDRERLEFEGKVIDANKGQFKVQVNENFIVLFRNHRNFYVRDYSV